MRMSWWLEALLAARFFALGAPLFVIGALLAYLARNRDPELVLVGVIISVAGLGLLVLTVVVWPRPRGVGPPAATDRGATTTSTGTSVELIAGGTMRLFVEATESPGAEGPYFQLVLADDAVTALVLSGCSLAMWRERWAQGGCPGPDPRVAISRLAERYRRLGPAAVAGECQHNFVLRWEEVHEVRVGGEHPEVIFRLARRTWIGNRRRRVFRLEPLDGGDPAQVVAELERELYGRTQIRQV